MVPKRQTTANKPEVLSRKGKAKGVAAAPEVAANGQPNGTSAKGRKPNGTDTPSRLKGDCEQARGEAAATPAGCAVPDAAGGSTARETPPAGGLARVGKDDRATVQLWPATTAAREAEAAQVEAAAAASSSTATAGRPVEANGSNGQGKPAASSAVIRPRRCMTMDRVVPTKVEWAWKPWLPRGRLVVLVGEPEGGKSTLFAAIAAQESGGTMLEGTRSRPPGRVLMFSPEQDLGADTRRKLEAAGADLSRVLAGDMGEDGKPLERLSLPSGVDKLRQRVRESGISCILFDPITSYLDDGFNAMDSGQVRALLDALAALAEAEDCLIVCTLHYRKSKEGNAMDWVAGAAAWVQVPRVVIGLGREQLDAERRVMTTVKNSLIQGKPSRSFKLDDVDGVARFVLGGRSDMTANDLTMGMGTGAQREERAEAIVFLKDLLVGDAVATTSIQLKAKDAGHSWATVRNAKNDLHIKAVHIGDGTSFVWGWKRPEEWPL
jgi:KaiC/GvpD/RAD55 family RecA-like ATPase